MKTIEKYCFFERTAPAALRDLDRQADIHELQGDRVTKTGWAPDNFSNRPLQNFNIAINGDSTEINICVRDHGCEDGDQVRVTVDGSRIYSGEIDNDWDCEDINVQAGSDYVIELFAINGTGRKGNCSCADINTGEIRVGGLKSCKLNRGNIAAVPVHAHALSLKLNRRFAAFFQSSKPNGELNEHSI